MLPTLPPWRQPTQGFSPELLSTPPLTPAVKLLFYLFPGDDDNAGSRSGNDRKWREALRSLWRLIPRAMLVKVGAVEV